MAFTQADGAYLYNEREFPLTSSMLDFEILNLVKSSGLVVLGDCVFLHREDIHLVYLLQLFCSLKCVIHIDLLIYKNLT